MGMVALASGLGTRFLIPELAGEINLDVGNCRRGGKMNRDKQLGWIPASLHIAPLGCGGGCQEGERGPGDDRTPLEQARSWQPAVRGVNARRPATARHGWNGQWTRPVSGSLNPMTRTQPPLWVPENWVTVQIASKM